MEKRKPWEISLCSKTPENYIVLMQDFFQNIMPKQTLHDIHMTIKDFEKDFDLYDQLLMEYNDGGCFLYQDFLNFKIIPSATYICLMGCLKELTIDKTFSEKENLDLIKKHGEYLCGPGICSIRFIWDFLLGNYSNIEKELLLESYIPLLTMNSLYIGKALDLRYKLKDLNLRRYDFSVNKKSEHLYNFLCKWLDLKYVKESFLYLNSHNPFDDRLKNVSMNELDEHILKIKEGLKYIWIMNSEYCVDFFGSDLIALTVIESTVIIKDVFLENLENSTNEIEKNRAEFILLAILMHECAHIKRKMNYNFIYYRSPKKLDSKLYLNNNNYGESGYWLEENLFGCILSINKIEGDCNEQIKQLLSIENWEWPEKIKDFCKSLQTNSNVKEKFDVGKLIGKRNPTNGERGHFATLQQSKMFKFYEALFRNKNC